MRIYRIDVEDVPEEIEAKKLKEVKKVILENTSIFDTKDYEDEEEEHRFSIIIKAKNEDLAENKLNEMDLEEIFQGLVYQQD